MSLLNNPGDILVINQINTDNITFIQQHQLTPFVREDLVFGTPVAGEYPDPVNLTVVRNTQLLVDSAVGSRKTYGSQTVYYHRLKIDEVVTEEYRTVGVNPNDLPETVADVVAILNERYGLMLQMDIDVADGPVDFEDNDPLAFTLEILPGSYGYVGSVDLLLDIGIPLDQVIVKNLLDGLLYPKDVVIEPVEGDVAESMVKPENPAHLFVGTGIPVATSYSVNNNELETVLVAHMRGPGPSPVPTDRDYLIELAEGKQWSFTWAAGLLEQSRGTDLSELYDITVTITEESTEGEVSWHLAKQEVEGAPKLVWVIDSVIPGGAISAGEVITDDQAFGLATTGNSQLVVWYGLPLTGTFTITTVATPRRAIWQSTLTNEITVVAVQQ